MKNVLAPILEKLIGYISPQAGVNNANDIYFNDLFNSSDYTFLLLIAVGIPLVVNFLFYKIIDPARPHRWHWGLALLTSTVFVALICRYSVLPNGILEDYILNGVPSADYVNPGYFILQISFWVAALSTLPFLIFTFVMRFISKNNIKNPF